MGDDMMNELEISCDGLLTDKLTKSVNSSSDVIVDSKSVNNSSDVIVDSKSVNNSSDVIVDSKSLDGPNVRRVDIVFSSSKRILM